MKRMNEHEMTVNVVILQSRLRITVLHNANRSTYRVCDTYSVITLNDCLIFMPCDYRRRHRHHTTIIPTQLHHSLGNVLYFFPKFIHSHGHPNAAVRFQLEHQNLWPNNRIYSQFLPYAADGSAYIVRYMIGTPFLHEQHG